MLSKQTIYLFLSCSSIQTDHFTSQQLKQVYDSKRTFSYQSVYSTPKLWGAGCVKITNELSVKYLQQASAFYFHGSSMSGKAFTLSAASSFDTLYADFKRISQPPDFIQCGGRLFTCSVITKKLHRIENSITEVDSDVYLERREQLIFTYKKVLTSWLHFGGRVCVFGVFRCVHEAIWTDRIFPNGFIVACADC